MPAWQRESRLNGNTRSGESRFLVTGYPEVIGQTPVSSLPTIRQVTGQFWGCERKGDFSIVVPLRWKAKRQPTQESSQFAEEPANFLSVEAQTLYGLFFTLFRSA